MLWTKLSHLTFLELWQNRTYRVLLVVAFFTPIVAITLSSLFLQDVGKVYVDVVVAMAQLLAMVFLVFLAVSLLSRDIFDRIIYMLLTPPMQRKDYFIGRASGILLAFILLLTVLLISSSLGGMVYISNLNQGYQSGYSWYMLSQFMFFSFFQYISVLGFIFFIISWSSGDAETMLFTVAMLVFCWIFPPILKVIQDPDVIKDTPEFVIQMLNAIYNVLPHLNGADISLRLAHGESIGVTDALFYVLEHSSYAVVFFMIGLIIFKRRDL